MSDGAKHDPTVWNEVWSSNPGDYYADTLSVSPDGMLKFHAAGRVICKPNVRALVLELWPEIEPKLSQADTEGARQATQLHILDPQIYEADWDGELDPEVFQGQKFVRLEEYRRLQGIADTEGDASPAAVPVEKLQDYIIGLRGVNDACHKCGGLGTFTYANTATWRGGVGGSMITTGPCDHCWGSGDEYKHWLNLRTLPDPPVQP